VYSIDACLVCGENERTIVSKYNRFIFMDSMWQHDLARFEYALCHGCGLVYATRRPDAEEYQFLYDNFNEFLMRKAKPKKFTELTPEGVEEMDRQFLPWWELRSAPGAKIKDKLVVRRMMLRDLNGALEYLPYIMLHVPLKGAKVLHTRTKGSILGDILKRLLGAAQVDVITLFPNHAYLARKNEGIRAEACLNYEDFQIPFEDKYDLIIENHMFLHMLDPDRMFHILASHLEPNGHIFFYNESSDEVLFKRKRNLFAELRPFHFQQYDIPTLERMLHRYGYEPVFLQRKDDHSSGLFGVVRLTREPAPCPRISPAELQARQEMYARWHDESILSLPRDRCRALFGDEVDQVWERVRATGELEAGRKTPPGALRRFQQLAVDDEHLEIGPEIERQRVEEAERRQAEIEAQRAAEKAQREAERAAKEARREAARVAEEARRTAKALRRAQRDHQRAAAVAKRAAKMERRVAKEARAAQTESHPTNGRRNGNSAGSPGGKFRLGGRLLRAARKMAGALGRQRSTRSDTPNKP
jgi:hypothetical protein